MLGKHLRAAVVLCCALGLPDSMPAQRVAPLGVVVRDVDSRARETERTSLTPALSASLLTPQSAAGSVTSRRAVHAGYGALLGAVVGGSLGFIVDQQDHTGEGFIAPVMIGAGAILGALVGALVGLVMPVHQDPAT